MAETRKRGSGKRGSAVLGLLSEEGQHGRLVEPSEGDAQPEPVDTTSPGLSSKPAEEPPGQSIARPEPVDTSQRRAPEVAAEPGEYPSEEERDAMSPAALAALPPPPSSRRNYKTKSQTLRVFEHTAEAQRRSWIDARLAGDALLSSTEHASRIIALGLAAWEEQHGR